MTMEQDPTESLEDSLDDWLGAPVPVAADPAGAEPERVLPAEDEEKADRLLARARRLSREQERINELAARRVAEIEAWRADMTAGVDADLGRVRTSLELFMRQWHRANPRRKSVNLPNGKLQLRAPSVARVDVTEEYAFTAWAEENGRKDLLRYKPEPAKDAIKAEEVRHARPDETIVNKDNGEPELYHTWSVMAEVLTDAATGESEQVSVPGLRVVQRIHDRFTFELPDETQANEEEQ